MGFEIENKYRVADLAALEARLGDLGATAEPAILQEDIYLAHPSRDFAATNEAFRVRRDGEHNRVTYKGPKHAGPTKTREEIEVAFAAGDEARADMLRLFDRLGFRPVATIGKSRRPHHLVRRGVTFDVVIDEADGLGTFVEVETLVETAEELVGAQAALIKLTEELGLSDVEPRSYLRMHLEKLGLMPAHP
jgi:adenylate cyclase class 2